MAELIQFPCPACRTILRLPLAMAGRSGPCPRCGRDLIAPDPFQGLGARESQPVPPPEPAHHVGIQPRALNAHDEEFTTQAEIPAAGPGPEIATEQDRITVTSALPPRATGNPPARPATSGGVQPAVLVLSVLLSAVISLVSGYLLGLRSDWLVARTPFPELPRIEPDEPSAPAPSPGPVLVKPAAPPEKSPGEPLVPLPPADPPAAKPPTAASPDASNAAAVPQKASALAEAALKAFLDAPDWAVRSAHVLRSGEIRSAMEEYSRRQPDGPTSWRSVSVENSYTDKTTGFTLFIFKVTTELHPSGFPVAVAESESGWNVDWESFVEFRDDHFRVFADGPPERSGRFHVLVSTPSESRAANTANEHFASFLLDPPLPGRQKLAYVRKDAEILPQLAAATANGGIFTPVIELAKRRTPDGKTYLEITGIVKNDWLPRLK